MKLYIKLSIIKVDVILSKYGITYWKTSLLNSASFLNDPKTSKNSFLFNDIKYVSMSAIQVADL